MAEGLRSGARDTHGHRVQVRLPWGEQGSAARAGLYLLIAGVTVSSYSGHPTRGCIPRSTADRLESFESPSCVLLLLFFVFFSTLVLTVD